MQKTSKQKLRSLSASVISLITVFAMASQSVAEFVPQQENDVPEEVPAVENAGEQTGEQESVIAAEQTDETENAPEEEQTGETGTSETTGPEAAPEDYEDEFELEGTVLKKYNGTRATVEVPDGVTEIGKNAFSGNNYIEKVILPKSVTKIGQEAFSACTKLATLNITSEISEIGEGAFKNSGLYGIIIDGSTGGDDRLQFPEKISVIGKNVFQGVKATNIYIGSNITKIEEGAFSDCSNLANVNFDDAANLESIGKEAFAKCPSILGINIPDNIAKLSTIGDYAFSGCNSLASAVLPDTVSIIGKGAFKDCKALEGIDLPRDLTKVSSELFLNCSELTRVNCKAGEAATVPANVTSIGSEAFKFCSKLASFVVPDTVFSVSDSCFEGCVELESVKLSNSLTSLSSRIFKDCTVLNGVVIPENVGIIGSYAFKDCKSLTSIVLHNNIGYVGDYGFSGCISLATISIAQSVTTMGEYCLEDCGSLKSVILPDGMTIISAGLFKNCVNLASVHLPKSLSFIGHDAFLNTHSLATVDLSDTKLTKIDLAAFHGSGLVSVVVPDFITEIDEGGFSKCRKLTSITLPSTLKSIGINGFQVCESLSKIKLPESIVDTYVYNEKTGEYDLEKAGLGERAFAESGLTSITIPSKLTVISPNTFFNCKYLKKAEIAGSAVKSVGNFAFSSCSSLEDITFPMTLETIGISAFERCKTLSSADLSKTKIVSIDNNAFRECGLLDSVFVPSTLSELGKNAFTKCEFLSVLDLSGTGIKEIQAETFMGCSVLNGNKDTGNFRLPTGLVTIMDSAFADCEGLVGIELPDTLDRICDKAFMNSGLEYIDLKNVGTIYSNGGQCFMNCKYLRGVNISKNMTVIPVSSFEGCESLTDAIIPRNITVIREKAFKGCTSLVNLVLYDKVNAIAEEAFAKCESMVNAIIPSTVQGIVKNAFKDCGDKLKITFTGSEAEWKQLVKDTDIGCTNVDFKDNKTIEITTVDLVDLHKVKTHYEVGESMNASDFGDIKNIRITKTEFKYENGKLEVKTVSTEYKPITLDMISGFDSSAERTVTLTVTYNEDYKLRYPVEIGNVVVSMEIIKLPDHLVYGLGDSSIQGVDLSGGKIKLTYSNGKTKELDMNDAVNATDSPFKVTGFNKDIEGKQTVKIWYIKKKGGSASASFEVTVKKAAAVSGEVVKMPSKLVYVKNELLDITGTEIRVHRVLEEQGYKLDYYQNITVTSDMVGSFDSSTPGIKTIHITYEELDLTFDVEVVGDIRSIEWITEPAKKEYYVGDSVNITGASFRVTFEEKDEEGVYKYRDVEATNDMVFEFDSSEEGVMTPTPYIMYGDKKLLLPEITVKKVVLKSLKIYRLPDKTLYGFGEPLDLTGGKLEAVYDNGESAVIDMKTSMVTSTYDPRAYGQQKITLKYGDLTVTFNVEISVPAGLGKVVLSKGEGYEAFDTLEKALSKITATKEKCVIYIYEEIDVSKMVMPAYCDLTIKAVGKGKIRTTLNSIKVRSDLTLSCPIVNTKGKAVTLKSTNAKNTIYIDGKCGISAVAGTGKETIKFTSDTVLSSVVKVGALEVSDGCTLTIAEKGKANSIGKLSGKISLSFGSTSNILNTDNAVIELVQKSGKALPKLTLTAATGDTTIRVVDEKGTPIPLASGTALFTAGKADEITGKMKIDAANGKDFGAVQYGRTIKAEYMQALEMGGVNYSSLEKALEKASGNAVITLKANIAVPKLVLPKTQSLTSLTIDGGTEKYSILAETAVSAAAKYPITLKNLNFSAKNGTAAVSLTASSGDLTLDNVSFNAKSVNIKGAKGGKAVITNCGQLTSLTGFASAVISGELSVTKTITIPTVELTSTAVLNVLSGQKITIKTALKGEEGSKIKFASGFKPVVASGTFSGRIALLGSIASSQVFTANKAVSDDDLNKVFDLTAISAAAKLKNNNGKVTVV